MMRIGRILVGLFVLLITQMTQAGTATGTLSVTANVVDACTVSSGSSLLAFGTFTPGGAALNTNGSIALTCTNGNTYAIALDKGAGTGATLANRVMTGSLAPGILNYTIYTTTGRTTVWGDGTASTATVSGTGTGALQTVTAYGTIFAGQATTATPGNYTDTVNVTVTFSP